MDDVCAALRVVKNECNMCTELAIVPFCAIQTVLTNAFIRSV